MHSSHILTSVFQLFFYLKIAEDPSSLKRAKGYTENLFEKHHWSEGEQK